MLIGALVLLPGLCISFYFSPARLYVRDHGGRPRSWNVGIAATTVKGYDIFDDRFREIVDSACAKVAPRPVKDTAMLDPLKVAIDHDLVVVTLCDLRASATLVLIAYFLLRTPLLGSATGIGLAVAACALQFIELGTRWNMTGVWPLTNLYGSLSLFSGMGVLIYISSPRATICG